MRLRLGTPFFVGSFFAVCALFFVYLAFSNFRAYFTMRSAEVRVLASEMKIDIYNGSGSDSYTYLGYLLRLKLETTDETKRQVSWEMDAGKAAYPEEAIDELAAWAPGTVHNAQFLRSGARVIRIEELERNPELDAALGSLLAIAVFGLGALFCFSAAKLDSAGQKGKRATFLGPWFFLVAFGALPLIGWAVFMASFISKSNYWTPIRVEIPSKTKVFDVTSFPSSVEISVAAKEKLQNSEYRLFTFPWNGKELHGGIGYLEGAFDATSKRERRGETLHFHISPTNRWALQVDLGKGASFWVPFSMLLLFGLVFTGAGLTVRKLSAEGKLKWGE